MPVLNLRYSLSNRFVSISLIIAIVFYILASYYLVYCLHHDEHFQIMEFANYKRGLTPENRLAWEFKANLRPTLQPAIAFILLNALHFAGIKDPFIQAMFFRLMSSCLFIFCSFQIYKAFKPELQSVFFNKVFLILSLFLYVFPITGTRFSSENLSSCFFVLGFVLLYNKYLKEDDENPGSSILFNAGLLFGISFLFRYQSAVLTFGLAAWLLVFRFRYIGKWLIMFTGFAVIFLIGILIDRWFYGKWVFSALNYLNFNLLEGKSANFGVAPWHFYITSVDYRKWLKILNISIILIASLFLIIKPKHVISWIVYPFVLLHFIIAHKETRFLYPVYIYLPSIMVFTFQFVYNFNLKTRFPLIIFIYILMIINSFAFFAATFSVHDNTIEIFKFIRKLPFKPVKIYYSNPLFFDPLNDDKNRLTPLFYKDKHVVAIEKVNIANESELHHLRVNPDTITFIMLDWEQQEILKPRLNVVFNPQSDFIKTINYRNWMKHSFSNWKLYQPDTK